MSKFSLTKRAEIQVKKPSKKYLIFTTINSCLRAHLLVIKREWQLWQMEASMKFEYGKIAISMTY